MGDLNIMSLSTVKQRVHLSLKKKVEVIDTSRKNRTLTLKALGDFFWVQQDTNWQDPEKQRVDLGIVWSK